MDAVVEPISGSEVLVPTARNGTAGTAVIAPAIEATDDAYIEGHVITISPQVSALVKAVHIDDNSLVHKGDLLVELDSTDYQVALDQATATLVHRRS